jgi:hypothetical protein
MARYMKARGKREAQRNASPLVTEQNPPPALKGRNSCNISALQAFASSRILNQGRRVPLRFTLAPGFHRSRLWRSCGPMETFEAKPWRAQSRITTWILGDKECFGSKSRIQPLILTGLQPGAFRQPQRSEPFQRFHPCYSLRNV